MKACSYQGSFDVSRFGKLAIVGSLFLVLLFSSIAPSAFAASQPIILEGVSDQGTFRIELHWIPSEIGKNNQFDLVFRDNSTGTIIEDVHYDWQVRMGSHDLDEYNRPDQNVTTQSIAFPSAGPYEITISNIEGLGEGIAFPIQVTPEIPDSMLILVEAIAISLIVAGICSNNLFRHREFM